ncbi:MAG: hypothetical protein RIC55_10330 [Pirellulaceae bacterium]
MDDLPAPADANPYAAPEVEETILAPVADDGPLITPQTVLLMRQTAPWVFFLSVVGFLFTGLFGVGMLMNFLLGALVFRFNLGDMIGMAITVTVFLAAGAVSTLLLRYGLRVLRFLSRRTAAELCAALQVQRTLSWVAALGYLLVLGLLTTLIVVQARTPPIID